MYSPSVSWKAKVLTYKLLRAEKDCIFYMTILREIKPSKTKQFKVNQREKPGVLTCSPDSSWKVTLFPLLQQGREISQRETKKITVNLEISLLLRPRSELAVGVLTDAGHQVVEDVLGEERVLQPPEVQLQDAGYGVHVVVILVPSQGVLSWGWETPPEKKERVRGVKTRRMKQSW